MLMQCMRQSAGQLANSCTNCPPLPTQHCRQCACRRLIRAAADSAATDTTLRDSQAAPVDDTEDGGRLGLVRTVMAWSAPFKSDAPAVEAWSTTEKRLVYVPEYACDKHSERAEVECLHIAESDAARHACQQVSFEVSRNHGSSQSASPASLPARPSGGASRTAPGAKERDPQWDSRQQSQRGWPGYASFDDLGDATFREAAAPGTTSSLWSRQGQARARQATHRCSPHLLSCHCAWAAIAAACFATCSSAAFMIACSIQRISCLATDQPLPPGCCTVGDIGLSIYCSGVCHLLLAYAEPEPDACGTLQPVKGGQ